MKKLALALLLIGSSVSVSMGMGYPKSTFAVQKELHGERTFKNPGISFQKTDFFDPKLIEIENPLPRVMDSVLEKIEAWLFALFA